MIILNMIKCPQNLDINEVRAISFLFNIQPANVKKHIKAQIHKTMLKIKWLRAQSKPGMGWWGEAGPGPNSYART